MLYDGILNPAILSLLARFRHTNTLVIADRGFPYWPALETADISLVCDIPTVRQVLQSVVSCCKVGSAFMAEEIHQHSLPVIAEEYRRLLGSTPLQFEPHIAFKRRVPGSIGLIRTADSTPYANIILESA